MNLPYLTADQPGIGGRLKVEPEDFFVEEVPLYLPSGEGQHIYVKIEKRRLSTYAAVKKIAQALNISPRAVGYAGLKDTRAVTRQTLSIDNVAPQAVESLDLPQIKILNVNRHRNKLKIGHLAGNRFVIKVREVTESARPIAEAVLTILQKKGTPNYFGEQRFGNRGNNHRLGELLLRRDTAGFVSEYLGRPQPHERPDIQAARRQVDEEHWAEALSQWPKNLHDEWGLLQAIVEANGDFNKGVTESLPRKKLKRFFASAFQSHLFNQLIVQRIHRLDQLEKGDLAYIHHKGAVFFVEDVAAEQSRADRLEISPSGPLFGTKTLLAREEPGRRERAILAEQNLTLEDFKLPGLNIRGDRRPYRFKVENAKTWWDDDALIVSFELPPGSYATTVMAEIMKDR